MYLTKTLQTEYLLAMQMIDSVVILIMRSLKSDFACGRT